MSEESISRLQMIEHQVQQSLAQRQQFQSNLTEIEAALSALEETDTSYKIIGNVMVQRDQKTLIKELTDKKETVELRIKSLEKQESQYREKAKELQETVLKEMEAKKQEGAQ